MRRGWVRAAALVAAFGLLAACSSGKAAGSGSSGAASGESGAGGATAPRSRITAPTKVDGVDDRTLLPPPAAVPHGSPAAQADALADAVDKGGPAGAAALETALQLSGIGIVDLDATVVQPGAEPSQGISVLAGEVLALPDLVARGGGSKRLDDVLAMFPMVLGAQADAAGLRAAFSQDMLLGAGQSADDAAPKPSGTRRFFTELLDALGRHDATPNELLHDLDGDVVLNAAQAYLVLLRGAADLSLASSGHTAGDVAAHRSARAATDLGPCNPDTSAQQITDLAAAGAGFGMGKVFEFLKDDVSTADPAIDGATRVGLLLSLLKLVVSTIAWDASAALDKSPLVRTKETAPAGGEKDVLNATLKFHIDGAGKYVNCLRFLFNSVGQDFNLPNNGPVSDAELTFELYRNSEKAVRFYSLPGNKDAVHAKTDGNGVGRVGLEGSPQRSQVPPDTKPFVRTVPVLVDVNLKPANIVQDLVDAIGVLAAFAGNVFAGATSLLVSLLDRLGYWNFITRVPIQDWAKDFRVDTQMDHFNPGNGDYPHVSGVKCGGVAGTWDLTMSTGGESGPVQITFDDNGNGTAPAFGDAKVAIVPGPDRWLVTFGNQLAQQSFSVEPGNFCDE